MEDFFKFFENNYTGIIYFLLSLVVVILLVQWIAWVFSIGRFKVQKLSPGKRSDRLRFLIADLMVKIINDFRHFLALIMVTIFGLVLFYSLINYAGNSEEVTKVLQAVISTIGVLIGSIIGYYFGESAGIKSAKDNDTKRDEEEKILPDENEIEPVELPQPEKGD